MEFLYHQMSVFREQNGLFWWGWLTPCSLQKEIRWVFTATWWNDCIFSVRGPEGDSERYTGVYSLSDYLSFFVFPAQPEKEGVCVCVWAGVCVTVEHAHNRERESVSLDHPVEAVPKKRNKYCVCVCVLCKTVSISRLESLPLGFSLSTVIHRALTSEDRHFFATGCPSLQNPQLINFDCFLCQLCLSDVKL